MFGPIFVWFRSTGTSKSKFWNFVNTRSTVSSSICGNKRTGTTKNSDPMNFEKVCWERLSRIMCRVVICGNSSIWWMLYMDRTTNCRIRRSWFGFSSLVKYKIGHSTPNPWEIWMASNRCKEFHFLFHIVVNINRVFPPPDRERGGVSNNTCWVVLSPLLG